MTLYHDKKTDIQVDTITLNVVGLNSRALRHLSQKLIKFKDEIDPSKKTSWRVQHFSAKLIEKRLKNGKNIHDLNIPYQIDLIDTQRKGHWTGRLHTDSSEVNVEQLPR